MWAVSTSASASSFDGNGSYTMPLPGGSFSAMFSDFEGDGTSSSVTLSLAYVPGTSGSPGDENGAGASEGSAGEWVVTGGTATFGMSQAGHGALAGVGSFGASSDDGGGGMCSTPARS